jgi:hypothetical protein
VEINMFRREDVRFPAEGGTEPSAWLFVPEYQTARLPAISMARGFAEISRHRTNGPRDERVTAVGRYLDASLEAALRKAAES